MNKIAKQIKIIVVLGAIFILVFSIAQVFVELPMLNYLMFDTWWFRVLLVASLWFIAFLATSFEADNEDE